MVGRNTLNGNQLAEETLIGMNERGLGRLDHTGYPSVRMLLISSA